MLTRTTTPTRRPTRTPTRRPTLHAAGTTAAVTAVALAAGVSAAPPSAAHEGSAVEARTTFVAHSSATLPAASRPDAERSVSMTFKLNRGGQSFRFVGGIRPIQECGIEKEVRLNFRETQKDPWRIFATSTTNDNGRYVFTDLAQEGFWRTVAPSTDACARAVSRSIHVIKN